MYTVIVRFEVVEQQVAQFQQLMLEQAENSLSREPECHYFDVVVDEAAQNVFHLYELYTDRAAFDIHLQSDHFKNFDQAVASLVKNKTVILGKRL